MSGRNPTLYCTLTLIAMQGRQNRGEGHGATTEIIMCLRAKGMSESTATFSVEAAGQVYNQTNEFVYLGGNVNDNADPSTEVSRRIRIA